MTQLTARDIMTVDVVEVASNLPVKDAARLMVDKRVGALPVVEDGRLVGIVTEGDLIMQDVKVRFPTTIHLLDAFIFYPPSQDRMESEIKKAVAATVAQVMTTDVVTVAPEASLEDLATTMVDRDVSRVPVMDAGTLVGIVSKSDIVAAIAASE